MKITRRQLKRLIRESLLCEVDTGVYEGDHDPIRIEIPALEKIATEENYRTGEKTWFSDSDAFEIAEALEDGPPDTSEIEYDDYAREKSEFWDKLIEILGDDWGDTEREELAQNIRDQIQSAKDAGYEG
tara:strand:- start:402 stop:788 length:387 start_codon:yes stop_codon:yes gene_type:complete